MAKQALGLKIPFQLGRDGYFETNSDTISQVSSNIQNLLLTRPGERRFNNNFGSSLYTILFEQVNDFKEFNEMLISLVQKDLDRFMNGVLVTDVTITPTEEQPFNNDPNKIYISVQFTYKNIPGKAEVTITNNNI